MGKKTKPLPDHPAVIEVWDDFAAFDQEVLRGVLSHELRGRIAEHMNAICRAYDKAANGEKKAHRLELKKARVRSEARTLRFIESGADR